MPTPQDDETQDEFISRCIPIVLEDGTAEDSDQAVAVCHSLWENQGAEDSEMNKAQEHKTLPSFVTKIDGEMGIVEHSVAVMGNVDLGGDRIHPGAFTKTITERAGQIRVLDAHNSGKVADVLGKPLALWEVGRDQLGPEIKTRFPDATGALMARTQFLMDTPEGRGAFVRIRDGAVDQYSIGYDALDVDFTEEQKDGGDSETVRNLRTIRLWEYSPVAFAMNPATATVSAKETAQGALDEGDNADTDPPRFAGADDDSIVPPGEKADLRVTECKSVNLGHQMQAIVESFYSAYPDSSELIYWAQEVWDDHLIVQKETSVGSSFWRVPFTIFGPEEAQAFAFASPEQWVQIEQIWIPVGEKNITIVNNYYSNSTEQVKDAPPPDPEQVAEKGQADQAGPNDSSPTKADQLAEIDQLIKTAERELSEET